MKIYAWDASDPSRETLYASGFHDGKSGSESNPPELVKAPKATQDVVNELYAEGYRDGVTE